MWLSEDYIPYSKKKNSVKVKTRPKDTLSDANATAKTIDLTITMSIPKSKFPAKPTSSLTDRSTTTKTKSAATGLTSKTVVSGEQATAKSASDSQEEPSIPLTTVYNTRGDLIEISIVNCDLIIPQQFIKLIKLAMPFHRYMIKLTICKGGLTQGTIHEINEMLPYSNITEVCLDDNYVRQGNYYVLLDTLTSLTILSLCRCSINDSICEDIVERLQPGRSGDKLQSLSLSTNFIGNIGACKFGNLLRRNRNLLHLNLADNQITYEGAAAILEHLTEFKLSEDEIFNRRRRKLAYEKEKIRLYDTILYNLVTLRRKTGVTTNSNNTSSRKSGRFLVGKKDSKHAKIVAVPTVTPSITDLAYTKAERTLGDFKDLFDDKNTVKKNDQMYCIGNLRFCYLNLACNDLDDRIPTLIRQVLTYQSTLSKPPNCTGLLKVVIECNPFSKNNADLPLIAKMLVKRY